MFEDFVDLERERFLPLLVGSNLSFSKLDLWLTEGSHDNLTLLVSDRWILNDAVISWRVVDHLSRADHDFLVISEDQKLRTSDELCHILIQILDMDVFVHSNSNELTHISLLIEDCILP